MHFSSFLTESLKLQNDDWEHLFSTSSQAVKPVQENEESHSLHNCTPAVEDWISTITFEKCARKLVTETGAKNGLTILEKISDSRQRLSDDFYYYCAKMSFVESEQRYA